MPGPQENHGRVAVDHRRQFPRLRRIEGQVRGLEQMIEEGRYCGDVVNQINAAVAALHRVQVDMLRDHLKACVEASLSADLPEEERQRLAREVMRLMDVLRQKA
ncbi:metal-sensitive transcriptional regulator [Microvirga arabica]|uniref:metal-sensitive transcriptional regulator n=1 Tax=Microvirga arabica TaxID=1128671 RepID=UPI00193A6B19|nr:metal-sensitive transcriptional regulator [Microvirga arabica]MBM1175499.1 metal-sensitive transcriptional regulator [Microvirga arabica]